jgi:hypothetical protein
MDKTCYSILKNRAGHIGYAVIFNNYSFKRAEGHRKAGEPKPRKWSDKDVENIKTSLERLHFKVAEPFIDKTGKEMRNEVKKLAESADLFKEYGCFVCVLMSHGDEKGVIYGLDWKALNLEEDIIDSFRNCRDLNGKPKLFFVQACRGDSFAPIIDLDIEDESEKKEDEIDLLEFAESGEAGEDKFDNESQSVAKQKSAQVGDVLVHYATVERYISIRKREAGSCFILSLCHVFDNYGLNEYVEIERLLRMVNRRVATTFRYNNEPICQQPEYRNSLNKLLYFNLALTPDEEKLHEGYILGFELRIRV